MGRREGPVTDPVVSTPLVSARAVVAALVGLSVLSAVYYGLHWSNDVAALSTGLSASATSRSPPPSASLAPKAIVKPLDLDCANRPPGKCPKFSDKPELKLWEDVVLCDAPFNPGESHGVYYRTLPAYIKRIPQDGGRSFIVDVGVNVGGKCHAQPHSPCVDPVCDPACDPALPFANLQSCPWRLLRVRVVAKQPARVHA